MTRSTDNAERSDAFTLAQRWGRAVAEAQAGEPHKLAQMLVLEGPPPASWHAAVTLILENPAPVRREVAPTKVSSRQARIIRAKMREMKRLAKLGKIAQGEIRATSNQICDEFGISRRTFQDIVSERGGYKKRAHQLKTIAKPKK